ncbi:MAG: RluA family pseudouridine synthase [Bacteroidales bacterium]|nr:RluA family pseudouridine synthase [Bacteroidales bacterium]
MNNTTGQKFTVKHDSPLLKYLFELFPQQSKTGVKAYLTNGQIMVNGVSETAFDKPLFAGDKLIVLAKGVSITKEVKRAAEDELNAAGVEILYEDSHLIVVSKRSGLVVIAPKTTGEMAPKGPDLTKKGGKASMNVRKKEPTVYSLLTDYVKTKARAERRNMHIHQRGPARVWIVHRIDRGTSGVIVFAKDEETKNMLQNKWDKIVTERRYIAVLEGVPTPAYGKIQSWLTENEKSLKMHSSPEDNGGELAITHYKTISTLNGDKGRKIPDYTAVEFQLETGRKNQIRVHAESIGCPVAGDRKYGAQTNPIKRIALHARTLSFYDPYTGLLHSFETPIPKEFEEIMKPKSKGPKKFSR